MPTGLFIVDNSTISPCIAYIVGQARISTGTYKITFIEAVSLQLFLSVPTTL